MGENEKLLAWQENLLVLDEWTALFSSPVSHVLGVWKVQSNLCIYTDNKQRARER